MPRIIWCAYLVEWNFNGVGDLLVGQGYQIKTTEAVELEVSGVYAFPEENLGYCRLEHGWLLTYRTRAETLYWLVSTDRCLIIAKDYNGAYLPEWAFNGIGDMVPGQGYQLKTTM